MEKMELQSYSYCSLAAEYCGPPLPYEMEKEIPQAIPIEMERIPFASLHHDLSNLSSSSSSSSSSSACFRPPSLPDDETSAAAAEAADSSLPIAQPLKSPSPPPHNNPAISPNSVISFVDAAADCNSSSTRTTLLDDRGDVGSSGPVPFSSDLDFQDSFLSSNYDDDDDNSAPLSSSGLIFSDKLDYCDDELAAEAPMAVVAPEQASPSTATSAASFKKGSCYRCLKGSRFTDKEACLVCNAKYCGACVLRAMGSMPEGRKCISCIGFPIEESKRQRLGKCSRMLKRLLTALEIQQVMQAEKYCEANRLRPQHICVNGRQLSHEEMLLLQTCPVPPTKLKPGYYWYDKVSGFWGKEGHKPYKVISPHLSIGGGLMPNASNGSTRIFINGREITKDELRMLKLAGVQCAGNPHFWLNADGSYQEEGQKNLKGNLWSKAGIRLVCSILSLPLPCKANPACEMDYNVITRAVPSYFEQRPQKLLLVGYHESGTSIIFKQAKFLYTSIPFSDDERESIRLTIQSNTYNYLAILLEGRERFEDESLDTKKGKQSLNQSTKNSSEESVENGTTNEYSINPRLKSFADWLLKVRASGNLEAIFPAATREYAPLVEELWSTAAIQATYCRRTELEVLPSSASYFLERVVDITRVDYEPSDKDILHADGIIHSNGVACTEFLFPPLICEGADSNASDQDALVRYQLIRVHTQSIGESCKWLDMFEDSKIVIFCIAMSDYDEYCEDENGSTINKMIESKRLFESIATHPTLGQMDFLLILNKFDLFEQKISKTPLSSCDWLDEFNPVVSRSRPSNNTRKDVGNGATTAQQAFHYTAVKFKRLFFSLTGRKLYVTQTNGLDSDSVDEALRFAKEIVKWGEERAIFSGSEFSAYSSDSDSFSP